jgi:hypothetical protein
MDKVPLPLYKVPMTNLWPLLLPMAACLHVFEEFVWPGGFPSWYRAYRPKLAASMTSMFFVKINVIFLSFAIWGAVRGLSNDFGMWIVVCGVQVSNSLWHLNGTVKMRRYSPGTVTGIFLYWPLAIFGLSHIWNNNLESEYKTVLWFSVGCCYQLLSNSMHKTRTLKTD